MSIYDRDWYREPDSTNPILKAWNSFVAGLRSLFR